MTKQLDPEGPRNHQTAVHMSQAFWEEMTDDRPRQATRISKNEIWLRGARQYMAELNPARRQEGTDHIELG